MHPSLKIIYLVIFAILEHSASAHELVTYFVLVLVFILIAKAHNFFYLCFRMRWLFIVMMLVYAYATPGEYVNHLPAEYAPSYEGLHAGLIQTLKIVNLIATISLILHTTVRSDLISGLLLLMHPLKKLHVNTERVAARLYLTLYYAGMADSGMQNVSFFDYVQRSLQGKEDVDAKLKLIEIRVSGFKLLDLVFLTILIMVICYKI